jgi:hypothetical protein
MPAGLTCGKAAQYSKVFFQLNYLKHRIHSNHAIYPVGIKQNYTALSAD